MNRKHRILATGIASALALLPATLHAATYTWNGTTNAWNSANWNAGVFPTNAPGDINTINSGTVSFNGNDTFGNAGTTTSPTINVNSGGTLASGGFFTTIWDLNLNSGTVALTGGVNASFPALQLAGTLTATGTSNINVVSGAFDIINIGGAGNNTLTMNVVNASDALTVNAPLQNNPNFNSGDLTKSGLGTLTLSAVNTYTGATAVNGGVLAFAGGGTLAANAAITVGSGATLRFDRNDTFGGHTAAVSQTITVNGGTITNGGNFFTTLGAVTLNGGTINSIGGAAAGFPSFSLKGPITVGGSAASTISGSGANSQMLVGNITAGSQTTFNVADATGNSAADLIVSATLQNNNDAGFAPVATGILKTGVGTMTLSGINTYTGATTVNGGVLAFAGGGTLAANAAITVGSGATLRFDRNDTFGNHAAAVSQTITVNGGTITNGGDFFTTLGAVTLNGGTINSIGGAAAGFPSFSLKGPITVGGSAASTISGSGANSQMLVGNITAGSQTTFNVEDATGNSAADLIVSATLQNNNDTSYNPVATGILKTGVGTMTLSAVNTYTGATTVNGGTLEFSDNTASSRNVYLSTQININNGATLKISGSAGNINLFDGRNYTFDANGGGSILLGTGNYNAGLTPFSITTSGGARDNIGLITTSGANGFNLGGATATFNVALGTDATSDLTITPIIANAGSILKTGTGRLTLSGANIYTGATAVSGGTLAVSGSISGTSSLSLTAGTLLLTGSAASGAASNRINDAASVTLTGGGLKVDNTFTSAFNETFGALTLSSASTLDFGASPTTAVHLTFDFGSTTFAGHYTGGTLNIANWTGTENVRGGEDQLIFTNLTSAPDQSFLNAITFSGHGAGAAAIAFGTNSYEIVAVPEPSSTALIGAAALLGLVGFRERRRLLGARRVHSGGK